MAELTITAANILLSDSTQARLAIAGEAITIGQLVFRSGGVTGSYFKTDADALATTPEDADGSEYALALSTAAAAGQPLALARSGATVSFGAILTVNKTYYAGTTAGAISDTAPASGDFGAVVGTATTTSLMPLRFHGSGVATP